MKFGVYFAYWEQEWKTDYFPYVKKVKKLGFDILEISSGVMEMTKEERAKLVAEAQREGITLTMGLGLPKEYDVSSANPDTVEKGIAYLTKLFSIMAEMGIKKICGNYYSYWPANFDDAHDKPAIWQRSVASTKRLADIAKKYGIALNIEVLNRFESFLLNDVNEGLRFVKEVDKDNVKLTLDTFHMNIEEDSIYEAFKKAGSYLGHVHIGECNRKVPGQGHMPWQEIAQALQEINYQGDIVMEPFVKPGGIVGSDIKVFRDLSAGADEAKLDQDIQEALVFTKKLFQS